ncbi:MAG: hypothetical protein E7049_05720 [Lentisphaerae bacterium]|nr:hypothetical protein [Lentisphaerota bacterium]
MKTRKTRLPLAMMAAVVSAVITARAESFTYEGRYLGSDGAPVVSTTKAAALKVYTGETTSTAAGSAQITIATDSEGYFATTADVALSGADGADTFWLGVTPEGGSEIRPRMRVSPAPYAIRAATARVLEVDGDLKLDGTVTITTLANADKLIPNSIATSKPLSIDKAGLENVRNLTIGEISRGNYRMTDSLSILRTGNGAVPDFYWHRFPADVTKSVSTNNSNGKEDGVTITASEDGIAIIMVRTIVQGQGYDRNQNWNITATLSNGQTTFLDNSVIEDGSSDTCWMYYQHFYAWSVPVHRGKDLTLKLKLGTDYCFVVAEAKIQFVYFGAAK